MTAPDRDELGRLVREVWVEWALEQSDPKPAWLDRWDDLSERLQEVDRRIGERLAARGAAVVMEQLRQRLALVVGEMSAGAYLTLSTIDAEHLHEFLPVGEAEARHAAFQQAIAETPQQIADGAAMDQERGR